MVDKIKENLKSKLKDWWSVSDSKRLAAVVITAALTTVLTHNDLMTNDAAYRITGLIIAAVLGDSYRPMNPNKGIDK